ncbi:MAG: hypothetical protein H8D67_22960 [Deltaproteobacteria bacterium]|nr:hypothetical protein [Deltaproteobacteria bacterium]
MVTKPYRIHTDEDVEKALALLAKNGGNVAKTAREMGIARTTVQEWKGKNHDVFVRLRREQKAIVIEKAYAPLISNLEEAVDAVKGQTSKECSEAALNFQQLITNMSDEPTEPIQVDVNIGSIDIRAITDRTQERLRLLDELSSRGSRGLNSPPVSTGPDGAPEASGNRNRDTKRFVHHEQGESEAVVVVEPDAAEAV